MSGSKLLADTPATLNESDTVSFGSEALNRDDVRMRNPFNFLVTGVRDILRTVTDHEVPQENDHAAVPAASTEVPANATAESSMHGHPHAEQVKQVLSVWVSFRCEA